MMTEEWFAVVGHDVPLTQGDIIVDCPLLKWRTPENGSSLQPLMAKDEPISGSAGGFATTRWSMVLAAGKGASPNAVAALATLCQMYWYPLYAFVRRLGHQPADAQDLTQEFFARLLEKQYLRVADPERGRFRSFLLSAFKHFLSKERDRTKARKRGGGRKVLSLDFEAGESRYSLEPTHEATPEKTYERRWALTLLDQVFTRFHEEFDRTRRRKEFDHLKVYLTGEATTLSYREAAAELGMTEGAVKVAVHRLRRRYRELVREEIGQTVAGPEDVDEELRRLFAALRSPGA
jgi:RNA polymerase sigma-70 factor (ECF subfamily)